MVRNTRPDDFEQIIQISRRVYDKDPWAHRYLASHLAVFPEGQLVAEDTATGRICGMAASLIVSWEDYDADVSWNRITDYGYFTNHDPSGKTLYGAEVMVDPAMQGRGIGKKIYAARRALCRRLRLRRIRAGARLIGYSRYAAQMSAEEYVLRVVRRELSDPTLTFQLKQGFRVIAVTANYLPGDAPSLGYAAVIEWINHRLAKRRHYAGRDTRFLPPRR
ncbi:MAG: GNAT family N-acetyltransferase [Phycisphaeraceae bacterium]